MKSNKNTIIIALIGTINIILLLAIIFISTKTVNNTKQVVISKDNCEKKTEIAKNENYVFLGDSITDWYPFEDLYEENVPIVNSGKAGYLTKDIKKDLKELVYDYNPTKIFILIGTNDLNSDTPNDITLENINEIIKDIKKNRPHAKIYLQSIYPINATDDEKINKKTVGIRTNDDIQKLNKSLKEYCKENKINYIDVYNELIDENGNLNIKYTVDGLHLSTLGYLKVTKKISNYIY